MKDPRVLGPIDVKAVITLAGEGTRMLPATRGLRKEMLPLFYRGLQGQPVLAPVSQLALRAVHGAGARDVVMVTGRDGLSVRHHFTSDPAFLRRHRDHPERLVETRAFERLLVDVRLRWASQPRPQGFGDAVLRARRAVGKGPFLLHAADALLWEDDPGHALRSMEALRQEQGAEAVLLVRRVKDPRQYGVVEGVRSGRHAGFGVLRVTGMEEKPRHPRSSWAATAVYALGPRFLPTLARLARDRPKELEVTSALAQLLHEGFPVRALVLGPSQGTWMSVGSPQGYLRALRRTYARAGRA